MKRVGVLGTLVWDTIHHPHRAEPAEQWGGLVYSLAAWSAAVPDGWEVVPLVKVGSDLMDDAREFCETLAEGFGEALRAVPEPNNRVELRYIGVAEREETLTGGVPSWAGDELVEATAGLDALYINHLSGMEMSLEAAEHLRARFDGPIYMDLHSLFLGEPGAGPRRPRRLPQADRWLRTADVVQLNETEAALLDGDQSPSLQTRVGPPPFAVLVTLGAAGVRLVAVDPFPAAEEWSGLRRRDRPGDPVALRHSGVASPPKSGDPTGCGDVWGSVLFASLLDGHALADAIHRAHRAAGARLDADVIQQVADAVAAELAGWAPS